MLDWLWGWLCSAMALAELSVLDWFLGPIPDEDDPQEIERHVRWLNEHPPRE